MTSTSATSVWSSSFRRSTASASVPPTSGTHTSGTSVQKPSRPTASVEWVSWKTWYGIATKLSSPPITEIVWPIQSRRNAGDSRSGLVSSLSRPR